MVGEGLWTAGGVVGDRYRIESFLDQGAAGEVYAARNVWTDRPVALKRLQPQHLSDATTVERFLLEGRIGGRIEHPNVVQTLDMGRDASDGSLFIVQELLRGIGMREMLNATPKMDVCEALDLMIPIMGAVYAVHQHGIVHRDIKPENIFISDGVLGHRVPKLLDFGIAKVRLQETLTQRGSVLGTLDYMAPEQLLGEHEIDRRADVWAIAVVFYELLAGQTPFEAASVGATINSILTQHPRPLREACPQVDDELVVLLESAMDKDRHGRPGSMQEMLESLLHWVNGVGRGAQRKVVARHRASIPAVLEARLGAEPGARSASDPLRATFRGPTADIAISEGTPSSSAGAVPSSDASISQMIPIVLADEVDEPGAETAAAEVAIDAAEGEPDVVIGEASGELFDEPEIEDPTEVFILVGGFLAADEETEAGTAPFDLERVVRAATGEEVAPVANSGNGAGAEPAVAEEDAQEIDAQQVLGEARSALSEHDFGAAVVLAERVFVAAAEEPDRVEARLLQAEAACWSGQFLAMERYSVDAYLLAQPGTAAWLEAVGQMASASGTLGTHERLRDLAALLSETPVGDDLIPELVVASCRLGIVMHRAGWPEHVETLLGRLTSDVFDTADARAGSRAWVFALRGELSRRCDQLRSRQLLEQAVAAFVDACDDRRGCFYRAEVAMAQARLGDLDTAAEMLRAVIEEAQKQRSYTAVAARARLADVCERMGAHDEGQELAVRALEAAKDARDWHTATVALLALSSITSARGDQAAAELHGRTAVACANPSAAVQADALAVLSSVLRDRPLESLMAAVQAMEVLQALHDSAEGEARIRLAHVQALEALEHHEPARHALRYACGRVMSQASAIDDESLRSQFLTGVREHAATLERGAAHGIALA
ncbi:MAG: protein kinase domain-containing protein [Myxococcota bacterium]